MSGRRANIININEGGQLPFYKTRRELDEL